MREDMCPHLGFVNRLDLRFLLWSTNIFFLWVQSEDDFSLSGIPVTALQFDGSSPILVSGDHSGMVKW